MSQAYRIARPYAVALFNQAVTSGQLDHWQSLLALLAEVANDPSIQPLLTNPALSAQDLQTLFSQIADDALPATLSQLGQSAWHSIALLAENQRLGLLPAIWQIFQQLLAKRQKIAHVTVESAFALDETRQATIQRALSKRFNSQIDIEFLINPALIGGLLIRRGDWVLDNSLLGQINQLKDHLFHAV